MIITAITVFIAGFGPIIVGVNLFLFPSTQSQIQRVEKQSLQKGSSRYGDGEKLY